MNTMRRRISRTVAFFAAAGFLLAAPGQTPAAQGQKTMKGGQRMDGSQRMMR